LKRQLEETRQREKKNKEIIEESSTTFSLPINIFQEESIITSLSGMLVIGAGRVGGSGTGDLYVLVVVLGLCLALYEKSHGLACCNDKPVVERHEIRAYV